MPGDLGYWGKEGGKNVLLSKCSDHIEQYNGFDDFKEGQHILTEPEKAFARNISVPYPRAQYMGLTISNLANALTLLDSDRTLAHVHQIVYTSRTFFHSHFALFIS